VINFLIMISIFSGLAHSSEIVSLSGPEFNWTFQGIQSQQPHPVQVDLTLSNQRLSTDCCSGFYEISIDRHLVKHTASEDASFGVYVPAVGGLTKLWVNDELFNFSGADYSSVGPIVPIDLNSIQSEKIKLKIEVAGPPTDFSGIWRKAPLIGPYIALSKVRETDRYYQNVLPLLDSTVLFIFAIVFLILAKSVGRKNKTYKIFSLSLFSWAVFYLFLSGQVRAFDYWFGSILHYPIRIAAGYGLLLLVQRSTIMRKSLSRISLLYVFAIILDLLLGASGNAVMQKLFYLPVSLLPFFPLIKFRLSKTDLVGKIVGFIGIASLIGQCSDVIKLFYETKGIYLPIPFLNRLTFAPLLLVSFGDAIVQFSGSFHQLRAHLFKAKSYARTILHTAKEGLSHDNVNYFLKVTSKICGFNRVSLAQKQADGSYKIIKLYGSSFSAEGSTIDFAKTPDIQKAVLSGNVVFGSVKGVADGWKTSEFAAVPVPEEKSPPYLMLLSDPKKINVNSKDVLPYLSQISSAIWTNLERSREQNLRIQTEKKFSSLIQQLDPHLYEFVVSNLNKMDDPSKLISSIRGIVFFDQKSYSTMTENFDDETMGRFARIVGEWVTKSAARYGARISNFAGDAFLLEAFSIGAESEHSIAQRTLNLAWHLSQTMGELNQILLKEDFHPITFRFGAHIGNVAAANLDFIQKGLSNSIGDTVNVTARLQSIAKAGSIYISGELAQYITDEFVIAAVPKQYVKGRSKKIDIFSLVGKAA
jgi:class 3 adenylate cyclase